MEWNILLYFGYGMRIFYHIISESYPFSFKAPRRLVELKAKPEPSDKERLEIDALEKVYAEGKKNIGYSVFSGILVVASWYLCFFLHFDDTITDGWKLISLWVLYAGIGWSIDSIFLFVMDLVEKYIIGKLGKAFSTTETNQPKS